MLNTRTFDDARMPSLWDAIRHQAALKPALNAYLMPTSKGTRDAAGAVWDAIAGRPGTGELYETVELSIPTRMIVTLRRGGGAAAVFACCEALDALRGVDHADRTAVAAAMEIAWRKVEQRRIQANTVREGFGCDESQSWHTLRDIHDVGGDRLARQLAEICRLAGSMFDRFGYVGRRVRNDEPQTVDGAKVGGDVERLLPDELAKLGTPVLADMAAMSVLEKRAMEFRMHGEEVRSRGPLVLALDESGSMHEEHGGIRGRNTWAKACAMALTRVAWAEQREVRVIHFGQAVVRQAVPRDDYRALFEMARSFLSGGTSIGAALSAAHAAVGDLARDGFEGADVVLVTDGEDEDYAYHQLEIELMRKDAVKLWTVAVGVSMPHNVPIRAAAEHYVHVVDGVGAAQAVRLADGLQAAAMANTDEPAN